MKYYILLFLWNSLLLFIIALMIIYIDKHIIINITTIIFLYVCGYFIIKNGIKKSDFTKNNIENMRLKYGGVALVWFIFFATIWIITRFI